MKVATETLRRGGWFITKVFRSKDYNALMYVANQLFTKVESNKPQSSRGTSAEIFMVCQGYKAPDIIDPRLLDPKFALEDVEDDNTGSTEKITSLKKLLTNKVNREGYKDGAELNVLHTVDISEFIQSQDPHEYLSTFHRINLDEQGMKMIADLKPPSDLE
jgi:AdoMet-dependent rRNA methyltransferase SPB1